MLQKPVITDNLSIHLCFVSMLCSKKTKSTYYGCIPVPLILYSSLLLVLQSGYFATDVENSVLSLA